MIALVGTCLLFKLHLKMSPTPAEIPGTTSSGGLRVGRKQKVSVSGNIDFCFAFGGNGGWGGVDHGRG